MCDRQRHVSLMSFFVRSESVLPEVADREYEMMHEPIGTDGAL